MKPWMAWTCALALVVSSACGDRTADEDADTADTTAMTPGGAVGTTDESAATTTEGTVTVAADAAATGAPAPPGGYALDSRPAAGGQLARIEYASPRTVMEVAEFYDGQIQSPRRVELDVAGDNIVVYALSPNTTVGPTTSFVQLEQLMDQRSEPMVVVSPSTMQRNDPLIGDLREAGQAAQADALLNTRSKITVIYAVQ